MSGVSRSTEPPASPQANAGQTDAPDDEGQTTILIDYIDEELEESMPASDLPAWVPTTSIGPPIHELDEGRGQD